MCASGTCKHKRATIDAIKDTFKRMEKEGKLPTVILTGQHPPSGPRRLPVQTGGLVIIDSIDLFSGGSGRLRPLRVQEVTGW